MNSDRGYFGQRVVIRLMLILFFGGTVNGLAEQSVSVGFSEVDLTPDLSAGKTVWIAGYGHGRKATGVHDPIMARAMVLQHGSQRVALVAVDLVGLQYPDVKRIRAKLPDVSYVLVASTHNHEGPDVIGIWGSNPFRRGVDDSYLDQVVDSCVTAVRNAQENLQPALAKFGTVKDDSLVHDSREPIVKDGVLRVLKFVRESDGALLGIVTQFSCHPESLGPRNTLLTADFPYATVAELKSRFQCPVVYFSGAVGGLMSNPPEPIRTPAGNEVREGTFEFAELYGKRVADRFASAVEKAKPLTLTPLEVHSRPIAVPVQNQVYRAAREIGVLQRVAVPSPTSEKDIAIESEVVYLRLGDLHIAGIPGELYPELMYGKVQQPVDQGADFPTAEVEPSMEQVLPGEHWLMIGLANDEIGYIIPKRQWDEKPPFCYGRTKSQYGEINSCGPDVAPVLMEALKACVSAAQRN